MATACQYFDENGETRTERLEVPLAITVRRLQ
jgi:hypothetical protein